MVRRMANGCAHGGLNRRTLAGIADRPDASGVTACRNPAARSNGRRFRWTGGAWPLPMVPGVDPCGHAAVRSRGDARGGVTGETRTAAGMARPTVALSVFDRSGARGADGVAAALSPVECPGHEANGWPGAHARQRRCRCRRPVRARSRGRTGVATSAGARGQGRRSARSWGRSSASWGVRPVPGREGAGGRRGRTAAGPLPSALHARPTLTSNLAPKLAPFSVCKKAQNGVMPNGEGQAVFEA